MHFPLFLELADKPCLVVGGGNVALRKARMLAECGAEVVMVAGRNGRDARCPSVGASRNGQDARCPEGSVCVVERDFEDGDAEGMTLVVAATDNPAVNRRVADLCKAKGIPVNVVDDPANCTFIFPAVFRKGPITAAVSSGGACPVAAKLVRDRIAGLVPDDFASAVEDLGARREDLKRTYPDPRERMRVCEEALAKWNG